MRRLLFLIPGDLQAATGGYGYDRRIIAGLRTLGWQIDVHGLDASFPQPTAAALQQAQRVLEALPDDARVLVDGLAYGAMPQIVAAEATRLRLVALVHHPLADESGLEPALAQRLEDSERAALRSARRIIVTSAMTRRALRRYAVDEADVGVVEPGTDPRPSAHGRGDGVVRMFCAATLIPRKGYELLIAALATLREYRWQLCCAGSLERNPQLVQRLRAQIQDAGIEDRVELIGEVDEAALIERFIDSDLFVLPTLYEGYGMAVAEAIAHGLPVISTRTGAIPDLVGDAGVLTEPGDGATLHAVLKAVLEDPSRLRTLAAAAGRMRDRLPDWPQACARMAQQLEMV